MIKIPRLFIHDKSYATDKISPVSRWVLTEESIPYRKWDGIATKLYKDQWYIRSIRRRDGIDDKDIHTIFYPVDLLQDYVYGWLKTDYSPYLPYLTEALATEPYSDRLFGTENGWEQGTYELMGPNILGNPEKLERHWLMPHHRSPQLSEVSMLGKDISYDSLLTIFSTYDCEGCVWYERNGYRKTKLRRRDFRSLARGMA